MVICARGEQALRATEREVGGEVLALQVDVTEPDAPARLVEAALERFGRLDVLVANAGGPPRGGALEVDDGQLEAAFGANALTSIRLVRAAREPMRSAGFGRICLITSAAVKEPMPALALSNTSRTALWAWAKTAAAELWDEGITLNLACPGLHDTERGRSSAAAPGAPMGDPADFGRVVAFLCSEPAAFVSGTAVLVDGARTRGLL